MSGGSPRPLVDRFGRVVRDLRVSVTGRCGFACTYCMPSAPYAPEPDVLSVEELSRLARIFAVRGVAAVHLTGGEPLLRRDLAGVVAAFRDAGFTDRALTTNGSLLRLRAAELARAGLQRVNVSLDSVDRRTFKAITGRDALDRVLDGIDAALEAGLWPVKLNTVVERGVNEHEVVRLVEHARATGLVVRFLEFMPLDGDRSWSREKVVPASEMLAAIPYELVELARGSSPARTFTFADGSPGGVGVIPTVTEPFCEQCDRLRITADGKLRACLFATTEVDFAAALRDADDRVLEERIEYAVSGKLRAHGIDDPSFVQPERPMVAIGG